jgi:hypothetical protein
LEKANLDIDARVIKFYKDNNNILDIKKIEFNAYRNIIGFITKEIHINDVIAWILI